jgi:hypothetical protein
MRIKIDGGLGVTYKRNLFAPTREVSALEDQGNSIKHIMCIYRNNSR